MWRSRSPSVLSRLLQLCTNRCPQKPPLRGTTVVAAASQPRLEAVGHRLFSFFSDSSSHIIKRSPPRINSRRPETQKLRAPWHHDPMKVTAAMALLGAGASVTAHLRYSEIVPFTDRTHLVVLSHREARELDEAEFAQVEKQRASDILGPGHPHTVRVRHIVREIVTAAHTGLAIKQKHMGGSSVNLDWMECLDWEVIVIRDREIGVRSAAGKILIYTGVLDSFRSDAEIAAFIAHEVAHTVARHSSEMIMNWFPLSFLLRRQETEADHIGMILFAVAGFDPRIFPLVWDKLAKLQGDSTTQQRWLSYISTHPPTERRSQLLSQPKVMEEAFGFYSQVRPRVQPKYPKTRDYEKHEHRGTPRPVYRYINQNNFGN